jgi:hypothetical protein
MQPVAFCSDVPICSNFRVVVGDAGNLRFGGYPSHDCIRRPEVLKSCSCDGQYSETLLCRDYDTDKLSFNIAHDIGACTYLPDLNPTSFHYYGMINSLPTHAICNEDDRPIFILIAGGVHFHRSPAETIQRYVDPLLHQLNSTRCPGKQSPSSVSQRYKVAFIGLPASDSEVAQRYPKQESHAAMRFNAEMKQYLELHHSYVKTFDFWNLTWSGIARTSDGFHSMTDINIMKAMYVLNAMNLMLD